MPKKIKELKAMLLKAGFELMPKRGKGSHAIYQYPGTTIKVRDRSLQNIRSSQAKNH